MASEIHRTRARTPHRGRSSWSCVAAVGLIACSASGAMAMYTPNPAGRWQAQRFFLAGDFQYNSDKDLDPSGSLDDTVGFFVRPAYSVARNVVLYGRLGMQDAQGVDLGFAGGFGVQGAYVPDAAPEWSFGGAFDYMHWSSDFSRGGGDIAWNEFQLSGAAAYNIPRVPELTPYAGILLDFVEAAGPISEDDPFGLVFGTNYDPTPNVRLDAQVRVINETGFFFSVGYLF